MAGGLALLLGKAKKEPPVDDEEEKDEGDDEKEREDAILALAEAFGIPEEKVDVEAAKAALDLLR